MASGVEVAGIVLAVLPLFISALEDYKEGLDPLKSFWGWERDLPKLIRRLGDQHIHYQQTLQLLLAPIASREEITRMITRPGGDDWKGDDIQERLNDRLGEAYLTYENTMQHVGETMMKIAKDLRMDKDLKINAKQVKTNYLELEALLAANPWKDGKIQFMRRVKFGTGHKKLKSRLDDLDSSIRVLQRWTDTQDKLETYQTTDLIPSLALPVDKVRDYACKLHRVLTKLAWDCNCRHAHRAKLQLEHRIPRSKAELRNQKKEIQAKGALFNISICVAETTLWQAAEVRCLTEDHLQTFSLLAQRTTQKNVSFSDLPSLALPQTVFPSESWQEFNDLCSAFRRVQVSHQCLGLYLDTQSKLRGHYHPDKATVSEPSQENTISLDELLNHQLVTDGKRIKLSRGERMALAVTLASSTLQLQSTPWLRPDWETNDIIFHRSTAGRPVDIEDSFLLQDFPSNQSITSTAQRETRQKRPGFVSLLSLGLVLIELYTGKSSSSGAVNNQSQDFIANGPISPMDVLLKRLEEERGELSDAYERAVGQCVKSYIDSLQSSVKHMELNKTIFAGIVQPLQTELLHFRGDDQKAEVCLAGMRNYSLSIVS